MISQILMMPLSASAASANDWIIESTCVRVRVRWRSQRSTRTPAIGPKTNDGIVLAKPTTPSRTAESVSRYTSQLVAIRVIHVPMSETLWPAKKSR